MPFTLQITVDGEPEISFALKRGADSLENLEKYWPAVADVFYEIEAEQFASEGARGGAPWAQHSPANRRMCQSTEFPSLRKNWRETQPILIRTGALLSSLTERGAAGGVYDATADSLTLGSSLPYALAHQRGVPSRNLPARPEINLKATDGQKFRRAFRDEIAKVVERVGWSTDVDWADIASPALTDLEEDVSMF